MTSRLRRAAVGVILVTAIGRGTTGAASYENSWGVGILGSGFPPAVVARCRFEISGAPGVSLSASCADGTSFFASGYQTGPDGFFLFGIGTTLVLSVTGGASADGRSIGGFIVTSVGELDFSGSLCGNGRLDAGEACDGGPATAPCCNPDTCRIESDGTACGTAPCIAAVCSAGSCVSTALPSGTPCERDGEACTRDACDGAGACVTASCSPCCDAGAGCTAPATISCKRSLDRKTSLSVRLWPPGKEKLSWKVSHLESTSPTDLGDLTVSGDLHLCLYDLGDTALPRRLRLDATLPAGGTCGTRPCWTAVTGGFRYQNRVGLPGGLSDLRLIGGPAGAGKLRVSGSGTAVWSHTPESAPRDLVGAVVATLRADAACWSTDFGRPGTVIRRNDGGVFAAKSGE